jgi:hypothetical protein
MHAPAHLFDDPFAASRGLARRASDLHREQKNSPRFASHSPIRANHGRSASISAGERQSMPIKDDHPPLPNGQIGNPVMDAIRPDHRLETVLTATRRRGPIKPDHRLETVITVNGNGGQSDKTADRNRC